MSSCIHFFASPAPDLTKKFPFYQPKCCIYFLYSFTSNFHKIFIFNCWPVRAPPTYPGLGAIYPPDPTLIGHAYTIVYIYLYIYTFKIANAYKLHHLEFYYIRVVSSSASPKAG